MKAQSESRAGLEYRVLATEKQHPWPPRVVSHTGAVGGEGVFALLRTRDTREWPDLPVPTLCPAP